MVIYISAEVSSAASILRAMGAEMPARAVEEAGEGSAVDIEAGSEGSDSDVAHKFFQDFAGVGRVVHRHGVLPSVAL